MVLCNVIILCKVAPVLTSGPATRTVWAVMNALESTFVAPAASGFSAGVARGLYAFAFIYPGYAYFYFAHLAGDT